ncbi:MAG: LacI family DNA-binding transcriptional regulator [Verrucomicrobiota bacterium]
MSANRVAITDVAQAAGVSKMTVSRALRGERGISRETRERVQALADQLGYRPDPAVSELMGRLRKSRITGLEPLAWLTTYEMVGGWRSNPGTCEMYRGAAEQARKLGYRLEEFSLNTPGMTPKRLSNILYSQAIRGIVMAPLLEHGSIEGISWEHFATACCGHSLLSPSLHRVSVDQFEVIRLAWRRLRERGYKRIGLCVSANDNERIGNRWHAAQLVEQESTPEMERVAPMLTDDWNAPSFLDWYRRERPDVVLSLIVVYDWMRAAGIAVPRDCGFALLRMDQAKAIAGIDHRFSDIGASAVSLVASELSTNQYGVPRIRQSVSVECMWRDGPTLRRPGRGVAPELETVNVS